MIIIRNNVVFMDREEKWLGVAAAPANKYMQLHIWVTKVLRWCKCKFLEKLEKKVIIHKRPRRVSFDGGVDNMGQSSRAPDYVFMHKLICLAGNMYVCTPPYSPIPISGGLMFMRRFRAERVVRIKSRWTLPLPFSWKCCGVKRMRELLRHEIKSNLMVPKYTTLCVFVSQTTTTTSSLSCISKWCSPDPSDIQQMHMHVCPSSQNQAKPSKSQSKSKPNQTETETKKTFLSSAAQLSNRAIIIIIMVMAMAMAMVLMMLWIVHVSMCIERALVHCPRNERNAIRTRTRTQTEKR